MKIKKNNEKWKDIEDKIIKMGVDKYGTDNWNKIASMINRTPEQCKERYENYISNKIEIDPVTFLEICKKYPSQYVTISRITGISAYRCYKMYCELCIGEELYKDNIIQPPVFTNGADQIILEMAKARIKNTMGRKEIKKLYTIFYRNCLFKILY